MRPFPRALAGEALGTALLLFIVVASGIAVERMTDDFALQLGIHALVVGAGLTVLILFLAPVSGAHFNPAVTLGFTLEGTTDLRTSVAYMATQMVAGVVGVVTANAMFGLPWIEVSSQVRSGADQLASEFLGTFVLVFLILGLVRLGKAGPIAPAVGAWIFVIIVATPSYGFANPAVTVARALTDTFTGIAPESVMPFVVVQMLAAAAAVTAARAIYPTRRSESQQFEQQEQP